MGFLEMKRNALLNDFIWHAGVEAIAAYQFKGASSRAKAAKDLTGHEYNLKSSVSGRRYSKTYAKTTWDTTKGFGFLPISYMENADLNARKDIKTIIIRYSNYLYPTVLSMTSVTVANPIIYLGMAKTSTYGFDDGNHIFVVKTYTLREYIENHFTWTLNYLESKATVPSDAVVAYSTDGSLYINGALQQTTAYQANVDLDFWGVQAGTLIGTNGPFYIQAAAFYSTVLDASTIADYSNQMAEI